MALSLSLLLEMLKNSTRTASDGVVAIEIARDFRPDIILLDLGMPRLDGLEAARRIRAEAWGKDIVLVALTGWDRDEDVQRTREAGFDFHLVKPVERTKLEMLLASIVSGQL